MTSIIYNAELQHACRFYGTSNLPVHLPCLEQGASESLSIWVVDSLDPSHRAGSLHDNVVLPVIDEHWKVLSEQVLHSIDVRHHKVIIERVVDVIGLTTELNVWVE